MKCDNCLTELSEPAPVQTNDGRTFCGKKCEREAANHG